MTDLGALRVVEKPSALRRGSVLALSLVAIAIGVGTLGFVVSSIFESHRHAFASTTRSLATYDVVMIAVGAASLAWTVFAGKMLARWLPNPTVSLHDRGIVYARGRKTTVIAWNDLDEVVFEAPRATFDRVDDRDAMRRYRVWLRAGERRIVLAESLDVTGLVLQTARRAVVDRTFRDAAARVAAGETLRFGVATVSESELVFAVRRVAWADVARVETKSGLVLVTLRGGRRMKQWIRAVPNVDVFVALCKRRLGRDA